MRVIRDVALETRAARSRLKARGKPYYRALDHGLHLGYRKGKRDRRWVVRLYVGKQNYKVVSLVGLPDDLQDADGVAVLSFSQAQAEARSRFVEAQRVANGLSPKPAGPYAVTDAVRDYLAWLEGEGKKSAGDARTRANALILPKLGEIEIAKLSAERIRRWLQDFASMPARIRTKAGEKQKYQEPANNENDVRRRRATANRVFTILRAALNHAWHEGKITGDQPWKRVKPFREVDQARVRYLTVAEAKRLINASAADFRALVQAALATGCRYGELCRLDVADFNPDAETLHVRRSKSGKDRHVPLTEEGAALFAELAAGREGTAPMLCKSDGSRWLPSHQSRPLAQACQRAKIDPPMDFHCLRHTYASLAVMGGAPLFVVSKSLGHSDTRMAEKHYAHLGPSYVADAIRAAAPRFGIKAKGKVRSIVRAQP